MSPRQGLCTSTRTRFWASTTDPILRTAVPDAEQSAKRRLKAKPRSVIDAPINNEQGAFSGAQGAVL